MTYSTQVRRALAALLIAGPLAAQPHQNSDSTRAKQSLDPVTITATRVTTDVRNVAPAVSVLDAATISARLPNTAADLLRELPGIDVIGTGVNQARPAIRGEQGQRVLLLEDGMRLNNARRQQDFGELPALVDVFQIDRVEVVRGPSSVLYGTDAIGGVINLITRAPQFGAGPALSGRAGYEYSSNGGLGKAQAYVDGRQGNWAFEVGGSGRVAGDYTAPAGSYGNVHLAHEITMMDSGVRDHNIVAYLGWRGASGNGVFAKVEQYVADNAGFGWITPTLLPGDQPLIQIRYPHQDFQKLTAGFNSGALGSVFADKLDVTTYVQRNSRVLAQHIFADFGPGTPPGSGADITTHNWTGLGTIGARVEVAKVAGSAILTYGVDFFRDNSANTDSSVTSVIGFGPTQTQVSRVPDVPNATLTSLGVFAQSDFRVAERFNIILGGRVQSVSSDPEITAGRTDTLASHTLSAAVYAANAVYRVTDELSVVASLGRGFRAPNLVERYFDGPTPEGSAFQISSPLLKPETSLNVEGGLKFNSGRVRAEGYLYQSSVSDGIETDSTGGSIQGLPVYQNVNVSRIRRTGAELSADVRLAHGISIGGNWSNTKSTNVSQPNSPVGDTYSNKAVASLGWRDNSGRFWAEYVLRHNGEQKDIIQGSSPVGDVLPAFTVHTIRGGIRGWSIGSVRQDITIAVNNLGNALYAEASNAGFFRPEAGRSVTLALSTAF
jgi:hemoglobin/transferrin/lactoferrin receptor protein